MIKFTQNVMGEYVDTLATMVYFVDTRKIKGFYIQKYYNEFTYDVYLMLDDDNEYKLVSFNTYEDAEEFVKCVDKQMIFGTVDVGKVAQSILNKEAV